MIYTDGVHLISDSIDELHDFANKIGLKRSWFQNHHKHPHYDIWGSKLRLAKSNGAKSVTSKEIIKILNN